MSLAPGAKLGPYEIIASIGAGGMGEVFKARDTRLGRIVAIKTLPADKVADPLRKQRFLQEAQAASALNHPNIVTIYDFLELSEDHLVMEFVAGKTLEQAIPRKGLRIQEVLKYAVQIADALAAAHAAGIVHRDIKPANILISDDGRVKVADFGLAKLTEAGPAGEDNPTLTQRDLTEAGTVVGSAAYMSPEQAEGKKVDARTDIFSFGAVLYEMLTGQGAFRKDSRAATIAAVLREEPKPARELVDELPKELDRIVSRCLRKDLDRRSHSMAEIKLALDELREEWESGTISASSPVRREESNRKWLALGAVALALTLAGGIWIGRGHRDTAPVNYRLRQITRGEGVSQEPALSPDGKLLAYSSDRAEKGNFDIWVQQVDGGEPIRITKSPRPDRAPVFSPDGTKLLFVRVGEGLLEIPALGGTERLITKLSSNGYAYSPDGKWIGYSTGQTGLGFSLTAIPVGGGPPKQLVSGFDALSSVVWLPDSRGILVAGRAIAGTNRETLLISIDGGEPVSTGLLATLRSKGFSTSRIVQISTGGDLIFAAATGNGPYNIWRAPLDLSTGKLRGEPVRLTAGAGEFPGPSSRDGRIPFVNGDFQNSIYQMPLDPNQGKALGSPQRLVRGAGNSTFPTLTADLKRMVYTSDRSGNPDIWVKELPDGDEKLLLGSPDDETRGVISPDGTRAVIQRLEGPKPIGLLLTLATGTESKLCEVCRSILSWTPDSKGIIVSEGQPEKLVVVDVASGQRQPLLAHAKHAIHDAIFSPDGNWVAFKPVMANRIEPVFVAAIRNGSAAPETEWIRITPDEYNSKPFWSPDGNLLYFYKIDSLVARRLDPVTRQPRGEAFTVAEFKGDYQLPREGTPIGYGLAKDRLYLTLTNGRSDVWIAEPDKPNP